MPNLNGYFFFRQDRNTQGGGGGVCIYVSAEVKASAVDIPALLATDIEQVWCVVHHGQEATLMGCIYRPPNTCLEDHLGTTRRIAYVLAQAKRSLGALKCSSLQVFGDFNFPHIRYESVDVGGGSATLGLITSGVSAAKSSDELFLDTLEDLHLHQLVTFPTYRDSFKSPPTNTLDLLITDEPGRVFALGSEEPLGSTPMGRAHLVLKWHVSTSRAPPDPPKPHFVWSRADWPALKLELRSIDWHALIEQSPTIDFAYNEFVKYYTKACCTHIPKSSSPYKPPKTPWITASSRETAAKKRASWERLMKAGSERKGPLLAAYKAACKDNARAIKTDVELFEFNLVCGSKRGDKELHDYAKQQQTVPDRIHALRDGSGALFTDDASIATILNDSFQA
jgi:hypothetical protein